MKLLFENFRKFVGEGGFSGNGPLAEPIEEDDDRRAKELEARADALRAAEEAGLKQGFSGDELIDFILDATEENSELYDLDYDEVKDWLTKDPPETFEPEVDENRVWDIRKIMAKDPNIPRELDDATITRYEQDGHNRREVVYAAEQLGLVEDVRDFLEPDPNEEPWEGGPGRRPPVPRTDPVIHRSLGGRGDRE